MIHTKEEAVRLLENLIQESGLSTARFAFEVLVREPRTVRRWLDGSSPIPKRVQDWIEAPRAAPWPLARYDYRPTANEEDLDDE